jgi:tetratricopeptide (TPR) repeat protein
MSELYSFKKVAEIFEVQERQLRYWAQIGLVNPSARKNGPRYTRADLNQVKIAVDLVNGGSSLDKVRMELTTLRAVRDDEVDRSTEIASVVDELIESCAGDDDGDAVPQVVQNESTEHHERPTAYGYFRDGCMAEDQGQLRMAEECYRRALNLEPGFAAALTNLGNLRYRQGDTEGARELYEQALELDPTQAEARYNLGNVLEDIGETEHAIAELRRVCTSAPDFADAHYNLGLILARIGGVAQAKRHLSRYIELDPSSVWARRSEELLASMPA